MSRPSIGTDKKLIEAGKKLAREDGVASLIARNVCREAGVNLGMFHYHFRNKKNFEHAVLKDLYAELMAKFVPAVSGEGEPLEKLKKCLFTLAGFVRENRGVIVPMARDILSGNRETLLFVKKNFTAHVRLLVGLIEECRKKKMIADYPLTVTLPMIAFAVLLPVAGVGVAERLELGPFFPIAFSFVKNGIISDSAIRTRIDLALRGLSPKGGV